MDMKELVFHNLADDIVGKRQSAAASPFTLTECIFSWPFLHVPMIYKSVILADVCECQFVVFQNCRFGHPVYHISVSKKSQHSVNHRDVSQLSPSVAVETARYIFCAISYDKC